MSFLELRLLILECNASLLRSTSKDWFTHNQVMCQRVATGLLVDCCFCEVAL